MVEKEKLTFPAKCPQCGFMGVILGKNYREMTIHADQLICTICGAFTTEEMVRKAMKK